jgi:hypothetical protein
MKESRKIAFLSTLNFSSTCVIYEQETKQEKAANKAALQKENTERKAAAVKEHKEKREALKAIKPSTLNEEDRAARAKELKSRKQPFTKKDEYTRGKKLRGGIDGYRHREMALKVLIPWIDKLKQHERSVVLLEDSAPSHT